MNLEKTIFISDMDETLFDNEKHISDRNLKAIMEYQKKGGFFTVEIGRKIFETWDANYDRVWHLFISPNSCF